MSLNKLCLHVSDTNTGENFTISFVHFSASTIVKFWYFSSAFSGDPIETFRSIFDLSIGHFFDELAWLPNTMLLVRVNGFLMFSKSSTEPDTHNWNGKKANLSLERKVLLWFHPRWVWWIESDPNRHMTWMAKKGKKKKIDKAENRKLNFHAIMFPNKISVSRCQ